MIVNGWASHWHNGTVTEPGPRPPATLEACCSPLAGLLSEDDAGRLAAVLRALADPVRLRLVSAVAASPGGEACVCDLTGIAGRSQATVSHHLGLLVRAGVLERTQRGRWAWYRLRPGALDEVAAVLTGRE